MRYGKSASLFVGVVLGLGAFAANAGDAADTASAGGSCAPTGGSEAGTGASGEEELSETQAANWAAWLDYQKSAAERLSRSPASRDWALATLTTILKFDVEEYIADRHRGPASSLISAAQAALGDALVQWLVVLRSDSSEQQAAIQPTLDNLRRLEPGNAAPWLFVLARAVRENDHATVNSALAHMAISTKFDVHTAELREALVDAYRRVPIPDSMLTQIAEPNSDWTQELNAQTNALAISAAVGFPPFQHLVNACRVDLSTGQNSSRSADCAATGRLLALSGDSIVASLIGSALLRVSHTYTDEDERIARDVDWVFQRYQSAVSNWTDQASSERMSAYVADLSETGREIEAMRRAIVRAGDASSPPAEWVDGRSPFSKERLQIDAQYLRDHSDGNRQTPSSK